MNRRSKIASNIWTQKTITDWAVKTFGQPENALDLIGRAALEFHELVEETWTEHPLVGMLSRSVDYVDIKKVLKEIADIVIVLSQVVEHLGGDLEEEVARAMLQNVNRKWMITGSGVGQHI